MAGDMKTTWIRSCNSFKEAKAFDERHYASLSASERLAIVQFLRESFHKQEKKGKRGKHRKGLRGFIKIVQSAQG